MINYHYITEYQIVNESRYTKWLSDVVEELKLQILQIDYIFCSDAYLITINQRYLAHDNLTDIITFDYSTGNEMTADIFISVDRIKENAGNYEVSEERELLRVMCHGILHLKGFKDKTEEDRKLMRNKEDQLIEMFHVEQ